MYRVDIFLTLPQSWQRHYAGEYAMCEAIHRHLIRSLTGTRLVKIEGKREEIVAEWRP